MEYIDEVAGEREDPDLRHPWEIGKPDHPLSAAISLPHRLTLIRVRIDAGLQCPVIGHCFRARIDVHSIGIR